MSDKSISAGDVEKLRIILPDATLVLCQVQSNAHFLICQVVNTPQRECPHASALVYKCRQLLELRAEFLAVFGPTPGTGQDGLPALDEAGRMRLRDFLFFCARAAAESGRKGMRKPSTCELVVDSLIERAAQGCLVINWWDHTGLAQASLALGVNMDDHAEKLALKMAKRMAGDTGELILHDGIRDDVAEHIIGELACVLTYLPVATPPAETRRILPVLRKKAGKVYDLLRALEPHEALTGPQILAELAKMNVFMDQTTLTSRIIPELKPYGIENAPRKGYRIPKQ